MKKLILVLILMFGVVDAKASATRTIDADIVTSPDKTVSRTLPAVTGTLMSSAGIVKAVPSGTINGSNVTFTIADTPTDLDTAQVFVNGVIQTLTSEYTISGTTITMVNAPVVGQSLYIVYSKY